MEQRRTIISHEAWLEKHQGELVRTVGMIWECGDPWCNCEQAQVIAYYANKLVYGARIPIGVWEGTFTTEEDRWEGGVSPDQELIAYRRELKKSDPDMEARIEWQKGIDYDG